MEDVAMLTGDFERGHVSIKTHLFTRSIPLKAIIYASTAVLAFAASYFIMSARDSNGDKGLAAVQAALMARQNQVNKLVEARSHYPVLHIPRTASVRSASVYVGNNLVGTIPGSGVSLSWEARGTQFDLLRKSVEKAFKDNRASFSEITMKEGTGADDGERHLTVVLSRPNRHDRPNRHGCGVDFARDP